MPTMRLAGGAKLDYHDSGVGVPIVFVHGYTGGQWYWESQLNYFTSGYQTVAMDLKGHGNSEKPLDDVYSVAQYAKELDEFLDHLGFEEEVFLAGHSMGGMIAQQYALEVGDKRTITGLMLMGTAAQLAGGNEANAKMMRDWVAMLRTNFDKGVTIPEALGRQMAKMGFAPGFADETIIERSYQEGLKVPDKIKVELIEAMVNDFDVHDRLSEITIPTMVIVGDQERTLAGAEELAAGIPNAELHVVKGAGHMLSCEAPDEINRLIEAFVAKHEG